jgi:hypothetical protein
MVKLELYAAPALLALTLTTSLALAAPHPSRDLLERDASDDLELEAREPSFFSGIEHAVKDVGKVAKKSLQVADNIVSNPLVQTAASFIPGDAQVMAAEKVVKAIGKFKKMDKVVKIAKKAKEAGRKVGKLEHLKSGALGKVKKIDKAIKKAKHAGRKVEKHLGGALKHVAAKQVHKIAAAHKPAHHTAEHGHHRRDLGDHEELSRRDLDAEELFGREYDDFLAERDFFDDLD